MVLVDRCLLQPLCATPISSSDWSIITESEPKATRLRALYVGNLRADMCEGNLVKFVTNRCISAGISDVVVASCSTLQKSARSFHGAHLVVGEHLADTLLDKSFWPRPVYSRNWKFKAKQECKDRT